jgi:hypothetical protein
MGKLVGEHQRFWEWGRRLVHTTSSISVHTAWPMLVVYRPKNRAAALFLEGK